MLSFESVDHAFAQMVESARRASSELSRAGIPHRVAGGVAVFLHVDAVEPIAARLTPDVDLAVQSDNLAAASRVLESLGYVNDSSSFRDPANPRIWYAVHLIEEPVSVSPTVRTKEGILIAPVADLVHMKLTSFRLKDKVHIQDLDGVGLITPEVEMGLSEPLRLRLAEVRATE
jgi:hypothetical protein